MVMSYKYIYLNKQNTPKAKYFIKGGFFGLLLYMIKSSIK